MSARDRWMGTIFTGTPITVTVPIHRRTGGWARYPRNGSNQTWTRTLKLTARDRWMGTIFASLGMAAGVAGAADSGASVPRKLKQRRSTALSCARSRHCGEGTTVSPLSSEYGTYTVVQGQILALAVRSKAVKTSKPFPLLSEAADVLHTLALYAMPGAIFASLGMAAGVAGAADSGASVLLLLYYSQA